MTTGPTTPDGRARTDGASDWKPEVSFDPTEPRWILADLILRTIESVNGPVPWIHESFFLADAILARGFVLPTALATASPQAAALHITRDVIDLQHPGRYHVHNHGPNEGGGLDCGEYLREDGRLYGACMPAPVSEERPQT